MLRRGTERRGDRDATIREPASPPPQPLPLHASGDGRRSNRKIPEPTFSMNSLYPVGLIMYASAPSCSLLVLSAGALEDVRIATGTAATGGHARIKRSNS